MIKRVKGNLVAMAYDGQFDVIVHGCNCMNTMNSGIAKEIKAKIPEAFQADTVMHYSFGIPILKLGNYSKAMPWKPLVGNLFTVINAYTQLDYNKQGEEWIDRFEYGSFQLILKKLAFEFPDSRFGFPMIGMGRAGGDPDLIISMLEGFETEISNTGGSVTMVEYDGL